MVLTRANSLLCDDKFCYFIIIIYCWFVLFNIRFACFCVCVIFFFRIYIFLYVSIYNCHFFRYSLNWFDFGARYFSMLLFFLFPCVFFFFFYFILFMFRSIAFTLIQKAVAYFDSVLFRFSLLRIVIVYFILFVFFFSIQIFR